MAKKIDENIVKMTFDNKKFDNGIKNSLYAIDSLKKSLNFDGASKSISQLEKAGSRFDLSGMRTGVDKLVNRFSTLGIIGLTAIQNITNSAINAGKRLVSSLTVDPIRTGLQEYETKMNAIQTILTNTQGGQRKVSQQAIAAINDSAVIASQKSIEANAASLESLKKTQKEKLKAHRKLADDEIDIFEETHEKKSSVLMASVREEMSALKTAHDEKLGIYEEEYLEKIKLIDEAQYNQLKAINDEINAINKLTEAEDKELEKKRERERLAELTRDVNQAKTIEERTRAEKRLADYKEKLNRKQLIEERQQKIKALQESKDTIESEFEAKKEQLKQEYLAKVEEENKLYENKKSNLQEEHNAKISNLRETYKTEKKLLLETQELAMDALLSRQDAELSGMQRSQKVALANIEVQKQAQLKALKSTSEVSKASTLEDVNKALNELNEYADLTIYNFAEMTRNVGTFTAAGVSLDASVSAIKGIANLAAGSGTSSAKASNAMYQLSQALAAGSVKLQDWNSVVQAGMGGQLFQTALRETAKEMGIVVDEFIPFRESLKDGWLTADVLTKTLDKFAKDETLIKAATQVKTFTQLLDTMKEAVQSGWSQSWEKIIGDKDEAAEFFTAVNDGFSELSGKSADARNEMLSFWKDNGGRADLIQTLANAFEAFQRLIKPITEAFREFFPKMTGERLVAITEEIKNLTEKFKIGEETADKIKRTFRGIFAVLKFGKDIVVNVFKAFGLLIEKLLPAGDGLLSFTATIGDFLVSLTSAVDVSALFNTAIEKIGNFIGPIAEKVKIGMEKIIEVFKSFKGVKLDGIKGFMDKVKDLFHPFGSQSEKISKSMQKIKDIFNNIMDFFRKVGDVFKKVFERIGDSFRDSGLSPFFDLLNSGLLVGILIGIKKFINSLTDISEKADGFLKSVKGILDGVRDSLKAYQSNLKAKTLMKIAISIAILAGALVVLSMINPEKLAGALIAITALFAELFATMTAFTKVVGTKGFIGLTKITAAMIAMSIAVLLLASALVKIAELDSDKLINGLIAIAALSATLIATSKMLSKSRGPLIKGAIGLILFAVAMNILADSVIKLSTLKPNELMQGLIGVAVLLTSLGLFLKIAGTNKMSLLQSVGFIALAVALNMLSDVLVKIAAIPIKDLIIALSTITIIFTQLAIFMRVIGGAKKIIATSISITIIAAALMVLSTALSSLGNIPWSTSIRGLVVMAGALVLIGLALRLMPKTMLITGFGLVKVAGALLLLSVVMKTLGELEWHEIGKGLVALAGSLGIIAIAMNLMAGALPGASALLVVALALKILAPVLKTLGELSFGEIGKSLLMLAGLFLVLGAAGYLLAPVAPVILLLSGAIALLGIGMMAAGVGLLAFSAGLAALAVSGTAGAAAFVLIVNSIIGLIPKIIEALAEGLLLAAQVIIKGAPIVAQAFTVVLLSIVLAATVLIPTIVEAIFKILTAILNTMVEYVPKIVDAGLKILIGFLKGIRDNIKEVVVVALSIITNFIDGISEMIPAIIQSGFDLLLALINGITEAINGNTDPLITAMNNLMTAIITAGKKVLTNSIKGFLTIGNKIMESGFVQGIKEKVNNFITTIKNFLSDGINAAIDKLRSWYDIGKAVIDGFINGLKNKIGSAIDKIKDFAGSILDAAKGVLGINSPSKAFEEIGKFSSEGFANGLKKYAWMSERQSELTGKNAIEAIKRSIQGMNDVVSNEIDNEPTIKPVVDLSDVISKSKQISGMVNAKGKILTSYESSNLAANVAARNLALRNLNISAVNKKAEQSKVIHNEFKIASLVVRDKADVKEVSRELYKLQIAEERG
jgi:tape measure domain-containing protein